MGLLRVHRDGMGGVGRGSHPAMGASGKAETRLYSSPSVGVSSCGIPSCATTDTEALQSVTLLVIPPAPPASNLSLQLSCLPACLLSSVSPYQGHSPAACPQSGLTLPPPLSPPQWLYSPNLPLLHFIDREKDHHLRGPVQSWG